MTAQAWKLKSTTHGQKGREYTMKGWPSTIPYKTG